MLKRKVDEVQSLPREIPTLSLTCRRAGAQVPDLLCYRVRFGLLVGAPRKLWVACGFCMGDKHLKMEGHESRLRPDLAGFFFPIIVPVGCQQKPMAR